MEKIFLYHITLFTGLLNGYILIISLGYMKSFDLSMNTMIWVIRLLKEYNLLSFGGLALHILNVIDLIITATPIFLIFGVILIHFLKLKTLLIGWISSIGILFIFAYATIRYDGSLIRLILDSIVIIALNIYIIRRIAKVIEARTKA